MVARSLCGGCRSVLSGCKSVALYLRECCSSSLALLGGYVEFHVLVRIFLGGFSALLARQLHGCRR